MKIEIKNYYSGELIYSHECENNTILLTLKEAIKSGANLYGANLSGANLSRANLSGANLSGANLSGANLSGAILYGANLYGADLSGANLYGANLSGANLSGADLSRANLYGAILSGADLYGANLYGAIYIDNLPIIKTLFITGSRNTVFWLGRNWIKIGCIQKSIKEWETEYKEIGKQQNYSKDQINEYYQYIQICKQLQAKL